MTNKYDTEYRVGSDTSPAERALKALLGTSKRVGDGIANNFSASGISIGRMAGAAGTAVAAIGAIVAAGKEAAHRVADLAAQADTAGVSFAAFQELKFVGEQALIDVDAMTDGLKELQLRADEFIQTGKGSAEEAFRRLGYEAIELKEALKEPDKLFEQIQNRIKSFDKSSQIRLQDEIFGGTAGEKFMRLLADGKQSIADTRQEARDLGIVKDDDMRETAEKVNKQWEKMTTLVGVNVKGALLDVINVFYKFQAAMKTAGDYNFNELRNKERELEASLSGKNGANKRRGGSARRKAEKAQLEIVRERLKFLREEQNILTNAGLVRETFQPSGETEKDRLARLKREEKAKKLADRAATAAAASAKRQSDRITGVTSSLQFELEQIKRTATEQEIHNQLRSASVDISSKAGIEIANLVRELGKEKSAREGQVAVQELVNQRLIETQQSQSYWVDTSLSGLESMILGTESVEDALKRMIVQLGIAAAKAAFLGEGPLAGLFGGSTNLFSSGLQSTIGADLAVAAGTGGLFAQGGVSSRPAIFGEAGPEAAVPLPNGRDIPVDLRLPSRLANDNAPSITYSPTIDARGADEAAIARLERVMADDRRQFEDRVRGVVQDSRSRAVGL